MNNGIDYEELGRQNRKKRKEMDLTQDNLADLVGCNTSHISNIENN